MTEIADSTQLESSNEVLRSVGIRPVSVVDASSPPDVQMAQEFLLEASREIQAKGWHWNTRENVEVEPDDNGNIFTEPDWLSATAAVDLRYIYDVIKIGNQLFDKTKDSFDFSKIGRRTLRLSVVVLRPFTHIPESFRRWMIAQAAREFQMATRGELQRNQELLLRERKAEIAAKTEEHRTKRANILRGTGPARYSVLRRRLSQNRPLGSQ